MVEGGTVGRDGDASVRSGRRKEDRMSQIKNQREGEEERLK